MENRDKKAIIKDIANIYGELSPENLSCDGEASRSYIRKRRNQLTKTLISLFKEFGREVSETEAYELEGMTRYI